MIENNLLAASDAEPDAPIDSSCTDEQHAAMEAEALKAASKNVEGKIRIIE